MAEMARVADGSTHLLVDEMEPDAAVWSCHRVVCSERLGSASPAPILGWV